MTEIQQSLLEQLRRISDLLRRQQHQKKQDRKGCVDPNRGQGRVLALLNLQPEISQKNLAFLLGMRNQSLSELLTKLEKAGYITKEPSKEDRRVMNVKLTEEGKKVADQVTDQHQEMGDAFDVLTEDEQKTLSEYLGRVIESLEENLGDDPSFPGGPGGFTSDEMKSFFEAHGDFDPRKMRAMFERSHGRRGMGFHAEFSGRRGPQGGSCPKYDNE